MGPGWAVVMPFIQKQWKDVKVALETRFVPRAADGKRGRSVTCTHGGHQHTHADLVLYLDQAPTHGLMQNITDLVHKMRASLGGCFRSVVLTNAGLTANESNHYPQGPCRQFQTVFNDLDRVSSNDSHVLLRGRTAVFEPAAAVPGTVHSTTVVVAGASGPIDHTLSTTNPPERYNMWVNYTHIFYMEPDVRPVKSGWLAAIERACYAADGAGPPFWLLGSHYRGSHPVGEELSARLHVNGNALYRVSRPLSRFYQAALFSQSACGAEFKAFDQMPFVIFFEMQDDLAENQRSEGGPHKMAREHFQRFRFSDLIQNCWMSGCGSDSHLRTDHPETYLVHGSAKHARGADLAKKEKKSSRNGKHNGAQTTAGAKAPATVRRSWRIPFLS